jgi:SulP family sulfate permease
MRAPLGPDSLRRARLFAPLGVQDLSTLCVCLQVRTHRAGAVLFREGEPGDTLLILAEGTLVVTIRGADRHELFIGRLEPGEVAGEMAFLDPGPRSATVTAETDAVTYELSHDAMNILRARAPGAYTAILTGATADVTRRLRWIDERIESLLAHSALPASVPPRGLA